MLQEVLDIPVSITAQPVGESNPHIAGDPKQQQGNRNANQDTQAPGDARELLDEQHQKQPQVDRCYRDASRIVDRSAEIGHA